MIRKRDFGVMMCVRRIIAMAIPGSGIEVSTFSSSLFYLFLFSPPPSFSLLHLLHLTPIKTYWRNNIDTVVSMLRTYHEHRYMIWNLSELKYNYDKFDNQVCVCVCELV